MVNDSEQPNHVCDGDWVCAALPVGAVMKMITASLDKISFL